VDDRLPLALAPLDRDADAQPLDDCDGELKRLVDAEAHELGAAEAELDAQSVAVSVGTGATDALTDALAQLDGESDDALLGELSGDADVPLDFDTVADGVVEPLRLVDADREYEPEPVSVVDVLMVPLALALPLAFRVADSRGEVDAVDELLPPLLLADAAPDADCDRVTLELADADKLEDAARDGEPLPLADDERDAIDADAVLDPETVGLPDSSADALATLALGGALAQPLGEGD